MKILNAHFLYPVDEVWGMCKADVLCCFVVIYIVKICVFMTSTSYCLCDTLMESKSVCCCIYSGIAIYRF